MHVGRERTTRGWVSHAVSTCNSRHYVRNSASTPGTRYRAALPFSILNSHITNSPPHSTRTPSTQALYFARFPVTSVSHSNTIVSCLFSYNFLSIVRLLHS
jgi:hypothetical protein